MKAGSKKKRILCLEVKKNCKSNSQEGAKRSEAKLSGFSRAKRIRNPEMWFLVLNKAEVRGQSGATKGRR